MTSKEMLKKAWDLIHDKYPENNDEIQLVRYAIKMAMNLAERNTPMKPTQDNSHVFRQYNCKVCNSRLDIPQLKEVNFCPKCGQRLDW